MARRKGRTVKKRGRKTKTVEQRLSALERALKPFGPAKPRGRRAVASTSDGPQYLGAYRL